MNRRFPVTVLSTLAVAAAATRLFAAAPTDGELARAAARISAASAFQTVETLASPPLEGRLSGTEGFRRASDWVITEVKKAGLKPVDDLRDYRQPFTHGLGGVESGTLTLLPAEGEKDGKPYEAELLKDFAPMVNGGGGDVTG